MIMNVIHLDSLNVMQSQLSWFFQGYCIISIHIHMFSSPFRICPRLYNCVIENRLPLPTYTPMSFIPYVRQLLCEVQRKTKCFSL